MKKNLFIYITIMSHILWGQVDIFYNQNSNKFSVSDSYYGNIPELIDIRTGYPPNAISIHYVDNHKDTLSVFNSFSCSQYSMFNNNKLGLYFWVDLAGYASSDCICVDEFSPEITCRPDTSEAIVKFYFQFIGESLKLKISNFYNPLKYTFSEDLERIKEIVNSFDKNKLVPLTDDNNKNYNSTLEDTKFLISYYYSFSFYCLINDRLSILKSIDNFIIENYNILQNSDYFNYSNIIYCQNLRKYVWANKGKTYFISINKFTILYKLSKTLSDLP